LQIALEVKHMKQSDRLLHILRKFHDFLVVMHDNPDPDAIAAGWGIHTLIKKKLGKSVRVVGAGAIVRAENLQMVKLLRPPIELVNEIHIDKRTEAILVDAGSRAKNHLLDRAGVKPIAVIDHHLADTASLNLPFQDNRPGSAASASIVASYLHEQGLEPGPELATAMVYAMRTETRGVTTTYSSLDRSMLAWLTERAEPTLIAEIENAPLSRIYFYDLVSALRETLLFDDAALCFLSQAAGAEIVGEVADLLIRCEDVRRVLCAAIIGTDLLLSARTTVDAGSARALLTVTLADLGAGGGHRHRAGGKIPRAVERVGGVEVLRDELRRKWLTACGIPCGSGAPLLIAPQSNRTGLSD
jgi:nanoRNase/pAp phosphatase (c-di-AMP/oligoRNAs hydrolase)